MKIGIMTFHKTTNYGACLQSVALVRIINGLGYDCEIIDYECDNIVKRELPLPVFCGKTIKNPLFFVYNLSKRKKFDLIESFRKSHGRYSEKRYDKTNVREANAVYDKFISGSDIIWELDVTGGDCSYFLDFVDDDGKKFSFSSSFGYENVPDKYIGKTRELLSRYSLLSVRERSGADTIKDLIDRAAPVTLDPTLFMTEKDWSAFEEKFSIDEKYVFLYFDDNEHKALEFAKELAKKNDLKVVYLCDSLRNTKGVRTIRNVKAGQFLWLIKNARYVVTGSYHGVVFSINYKTPFFYVNRAHQSRITTITESLEITGKDILSPDELNFDFDWENIGRKLGKKREESKAYLMEILER